MYHVEKTKEYWRTTFCVLYCTYTVLYIDSIYTLQGIHVVHMYINCVDSDLYVSMDACTNQTAMSSH